MTNRPYTGWVIVPVKTLVILSIYAPEPISAAQLSAPSPLDDAELVERVARAIFETPDFGAPACVSWVNRGNSFKQDEARSYALAAITAIITPKEG